MMNRPPKSALRALRLLLGAAACQLGCSEPTRIEEVTHAPEATEAQPATGLEAHSQIQEVVRPETPGVRSEVPPASAGEPILALRFADENEPLHRPEPWLAEAPHLDALLPTGAARALRERWFMEETFEPGRTRWSVHEVWGIFGRGGPDAWARLEQRLEVYGQQARRDIPPVLQVFDPGLASGQVRVARGGSGVRAWFDDLGSHRPVLVAASGTGEGGLQITVMVFHELTDPSPIAQFVELLAASHPLVATMGNVLDDASSASLTRTGRGVWVSAVFDRERSAEEIRAIDSIEIGLDLDELHRQLRPIRARWTAPWLSRIGRAARRAGLSANPTEEIPERWVSGDRRVHVIDNSCFVSIGAERLRL